MGLFSKYKYPEPERLSIEEARDRRLSALLERERRFAEIPNFLQVRNEVQRKATLSQVTKNILAESEVRKGIGPKAASIAAALSLFKEKDFADPQLRNAYRELRRRQGGQQNVTPTGGDKRRFNPTGKDFASTVYGTIARLTDVTSALPKGKWQPRFQSPWSVIPCVQRSVRREVMFAKKHAGRGYRVPHRRSWSSGVPC